MKLSTKNISYSLALLLCLCTSLVHAHEDHEDHESHGSMDMGSNEDAEGNLIPVPHAGGHHHGMPILEMPLKPEEKLYWEQYNTTTYFSFDETNFKHKINKSFLSYHTFMIAALTIVTYPILLSLNNVNNKWFLFFLIANYGFVVSGMISILIFHKQLTRNDIHLFPNNCYSTLNVILLLLLTVHLISAIVKKSTEFFLFGNSQMENVDYEMLYMLPESDNQEQSSPLDFELNEDGSTRFSGETQQGPDSRSDSNETHDVTGRYNMRSQAENLFGGKVKKLSEKRNSLYVRVYNISLIKQLSVHFHRLFSLTFNLLNYLILFYLFVHCGMGLAIGNLLGTPSNKIFNLLAHWIKGGVFITLGLVSLSRYCGFGLNKSWGWNLSILKRSDYYNEVTGRYNIPLWIKVFGKSGVNLEFIEVFLVFFYGSTNIFLEHLASEDGKWSAKDLQHVSIAFLYLGAGLCGLLVEFYMSDVKYKMALKQYKKIINETENRDLTEEEIDDIIVANPGFSLNPLGPFTIFWTGILMSKHAQASAVSTAVHVQWGSLLSYGSPFRLFSMLYMLAFPATEVGVPQRPFTEIIASFCLLAGGFIFMESTDQVIEAMEYRGYTEMFTFNISVGLITILMSWIIILFIWKDWLVKKNKDKTL